MQLDRLRWTLTAGAIRVPLAGLLLVMFSSCQSLDYYMHAARGQMSLLWARESIESMLARPDLEPWIGDKLRLVEAARRFAAEDLDLPVNDAYASYVELTDRHVVWNLQAAGEFSTRNHEWCFPIAGCVAYKGYFEEGLARRSASEMSAAGFDVYVRGVDAYSTLGWFEDPVLSSFIDYPDQSLAALLFHELAHRKLYVTGDTSFNESWATAIQIVASERWAEVGRPALAADQVLRQLQATAMVNRLVDRTLQDLEGIYRQDALDARQKRARKQAVLDELPAHYHALEADFGQSMGYRDFFSQPLNNAALLSLGHYTLWVPAFLQKYRQLDFDLDRFYDWSIALASLGKTERDAILAVLQAAAS